MCDGCKKLAERSLDLLHRQSEGETVRARVHLDHRRKAKPHCDYPETCTCQHRRIQDAFVRRSD